MEEHLKDPVSDLSGGSLNIPSLSIPRKVKSGVWGIPHGTDAFCASNDASLFSSSLPVLPHEKLNFADSEDHGRSIDDRSPILNNIDLENEGKVLLEGVEPNAVGTLLPDDEDELLAGITDDFDLSGLPSQLEDLEDYDLFGSGGGMELDFEPQESLSFGMSKINISDGVGGNGIAHYPLSNGVGTVAGEHPYGEHPSRTLFVRNINSNVEDSELRSLFEQYGDIRTLYTACKHRGFVMISYYDIRAARTAMRALQNKPLRRRKLDIHFSIPKDNPSEKDINQGTLVVFNLDASVSNDDLRQIFGAYGEVKEIRETPHKRHHKFIEFYDVRAAEAALRALNRSDIAGKRIKLEPSRPGGARRNLMQQLSQELEQEEARGFRHQVGSPVTNSPPGSRVGVGLPGNVNENGSSSLRLMSLPRHGPMFLGNSSYPGPGAINNEGLTERGRSRRIESNGSQTDSKKQYQLDLDKIISGEDTRTTLMIKNIPNKYTSKMLLAAIDENHCGTYDFLYLPIDFKNKCNVGYAFINMVSPSHIMSFYEAFNGKKWEKFNSEKVASLAYARIQGKTALVTHFQNSSLMNEDKRCRPILFHSEGQETGDQEPFLSGNLNIFIRQPDGSYSGDSLEISKGNLEEKPEKI